MSITESRQRLLDGLGGDPLVSVTAASKILGIPRANFRRDALEHLTPIPVDGSADVYLRSEVIELAARWRANGRRATVNAAAA